MNSIRKNLKNVFKMFINYIKVRFYEKLGCELMQYKEEYSVGDLIINEFTFNGVSNPYSKKDICIIKSIVGKYIIVKPLKCKLHKNVSNFDYKEFFKMGG